MRRVAASIVIMCLGATTGFAQLLPSFPTGDLCFSSAGYLQGFDVHDLDAITMATPLGGIAFSSDGLAFDAAGNLYNGNDGLDVYDSSLTLIGHASVDDPISNRTFFLALRGNGQVFAGNPVRPPQAPFARLHVFDASDPHHPTHINTVDIPGTDTFGGTECRGLAFDSDGNLWVGSYVWLIKLTLDALGNPIASESFRTEYNPLGLAFQPGTGRLFYTGVNSNVVEVVDPADPARGVLTPNHGIATITNVGDNANNNPFTCAFNSSGDLFVSCSNYDGATTDLVVFRSASLTGLSGIVDASTLNPIRFSWSDGYQTGILAFRPPLTSPVVDRDGDGLTDADETTTWHTDPDDADTDDDGLLDGTEVEMAMGDGCPDPLDADSDDDGLLDGAEVAAGTSPCSADTDGDGVADGDDPTPLVPGVTCAWLEAAAIELADAIDALPLSLFTGANNNANSGRRNSLSTRVRNAGKAFSRCEHAPAIALLSNVLQQVDGITPVPDWMVASPEKTALAATLMLLIDLAELTD